MKRKYDLRNKRNFMIVLGLSILIIGIFSLFIYKYQHASKIAYNVDIDSVIQDTNKTFIKVNEDAVIGKRWNDSYYLNYQDKKTNLGKRVIVYNTITGALKLYGKFYEISVDGKVSTTKDETVLKNTSDTKFYKIDDREYLLVDKYVVSDDRSVNASNYLLVELDRMGNAKLSNYKLNLKTIAPTKLVTTKYVFDIANEKLNYENNEIDLKKIIGSTNEYEEETPKGSGSGEGEGTGGGSGAGNAANQTQNQPEVINNNETGDATGIDEIKDKVRMTSIVSHQETLTQSNIDYVIYDPYNEYKSVYAEINRGGGKIDTVYLSKTDTHMVINDLLPNTEYNVKFSYTVADPDTGVLIPTTFDELTLKTRKPAYSIAVYKISKVKNTLTYKVNLQEGYTINKLNVNLKFKYRVTNPETGNDYIENASLDSVVTIDSMSKSLMGTIDIAGYDIEKGTTLYLELVSVEGPSGILKLDGVSNSFKF